MNRMYAVLYPLVWLFMRLFHPWKSVGLGRGPEGNGVLCGNHTTLGDPVYVVCALGRRRQTHIMAKDEIVRWPVVGWLLRRAGIIGVKRGKADVGAIKESIRVLRNGEKLLLFPEGTRVREGERSEAHTGAAMFATRTGAPIVPVYIQPQKRLFRPTTVIFGQPYHPQIDGAKPTPEDYHRIAEDMMARIRQLGGER